MSLSFKGGKIPAVGFGTGTKWYKDGNAPIDQNVVNAITSALEVKQYHIDTAEVYGTHAEVGVAINGFLSKHPEVTRKDLFITDKFFLGNISPYKTVLDTLKKTKLEYLDLYLIHCPFVETVKEDLTIKQLWGECEKLKEEGYVKNIGVSNFRVDDIKDLLTYAKYPPVINQIEYSLVLQNQSPGIVKFCQSHDILVEAYSPLAPIIKATSSDYDDLHKELKALGAKYGVSEASIALRWVNETGVVAITTSAKKERVVESLEIFKFELTKEEVAKLTEIAGKAPIIRQYWTDNF